MSFISFIKEAGEKLFNLGKPDSITTAALAELNQKAADAIRAYIHAQKLDVQNLAVAYDSVTMAVTVSGTAADQATREKIVLCCGNVSSVEKVNDQLTASAASEEARFYTVKNDDALLKISKELYGDASKYSVIFEANKPMLNDPDRIYPGQMLRIPALA